MGKRGKNLNYKRIRWLCCILGDVYVLVLLFFIWVYYFHFHVLCRQCSVLSHQSSLISQQTSIIFSPKTQLKYYQPKSKFATTLPVNWTLFNNFVSSAWAMAIKWQSMNFQKNLMGSKTQIKSYERKISYNKVNTIYVIKIIVFV